MSLGMAEPALLILVSLASGPRHGYAVILDVEALCGVRLGPGTLYGAIARLERLGLIEPLASDDRRRPYRLTDAGAAALERELAALRDVATTGLRRLEAS
jgi:DNA-binding PadR family transcriptional regulator